MNRTPVFDLVRNMVPEKRLSADQVNRINSVLSDLERFVLPLKHAAYILATAHHESDRWRAVEEYASGADYEGRKDLGNIHKGDGKRFKGRGLVQITGRRNYSDWSNRLGVDLLSNPELAKETRIAARILVEGSFLGTFTGKKLADYKTYEQMRRVINKTDRAKLIAGYARKFEAALVEAGYGKSPQMPKERDKPETAPDTAPAPETAPAVKSGWLAFILSLFGRK
jgi:hypothetical protein